MVIGHGNDASVLQETINILDDPQIDFFIHWDKKFVRPKLFSNKSKIFFVNSIEVTWGTDSQMEAELILLKAIQKHSGYTMAHLISSADMPLMDKDYFLNYFSDGRSYLGFAEGPSNISKDNIERIKFYWPKIGLRNHHLLSRAIRIYGRLFHVNRLRNKNLTVCKGPNWFSINTNLIPKVLHADKNPFMHSFCVDEIFMQTILSELYVSTKKDDNAQAARYIDWKRGQPYTFSLSDVKELQKVKNTDYAFARKVNDRSLIQDVFRN